MYPGRPPQNPGIRGSQMVQYPGMYYKGTSAPSPWPLLQAAPVSSASSADFVQYPSKYSTPTPTPSSAHSATRSALAESYERIRNEMRGLKGETRENKSPSFGGHTAPPPPNLKLKNDPLSSLCDNTSVSLSSLLEAAMAPSSGSNKRTKEDPLMKKTILEKCERKIAQLYRDRITGMGSFFPLIETNTSPASNATNLLRHCPRLEFNMEPIKTLWMCPDVIIELVKSQTSMVVSKNDGKQSSSMFCEMNLEICPSSPPSNASPEVVKIPTMDSSSEPPLSSVDKITDSTFEQWAKIEREKRNRERELEWEKLIEFTQINSQSIERDDRKKRSCSRSRKRGSRDQRSRSRNRRSRSSSLSSSSRGRSRNRSRSWDRSRRHQRSSSLSLSPTPSPCKGDKSGSRSSRAYTPRNSSRRRNGSPHSRKEASKNDWPSTSTNSSWPGSNSASAVTQSMYKPPPAFYEPPPPIGGINVQGEYPCSPMNVPQCQPSSANHAAGWPYCPAGIPRMPFTPYGPAGLRPGLPLRPPGLPMPGMGPWPGNVHGPMPVLPPPRGLCAASNFISNFVQANTMGRSSNEVIVIDDHENSPEPIGPPGLSPERKLSPHAYNRGSSPPVNPLRLKCSMLLWRLQKIHQLLRQIQRGSVSHQDLIQEMEMNGREFHGVHTMIDGFLCRLVINKGNSSDKSFKLVIPSSKIHSVLWDIHDVYHDLTLEQLHSLIEELFFDSHLFTRRLPSLFEKCARCITFNRRTENSDSRRSSRLESKNKSREREDRHSRDQRHGKNDHRSNKSRSPRRRSREQRDRSSTKKSRSPRNHSKERGVQDTRKRSRSPTNNSKEKCDRDVRKISCSLRKGLKERSGRGASKRSHYPLKRLKESSNEKSKCDKPEKIHDQPTKRTDTSSHDTELLIEPEQKNDLRKKMFETIAGKSEESISIIGSLDETNGTGSFDRGGERKPPEVAIEKPVDPQPVQLEAEKKYVIKGKKFDIAVDFKTRVREVQLSVEKLKNVIEELEGPARKSDDPSLLMKAGMLCRRLVLEQKAEIKIVVTAEILPNMIQIVHTMAPIHAPAPKTITVYKKHFSPLDNIDEVVVKVLDDCETCNASK